jgi:hypothetical protein
MVDTRTVTLPALWADDAITEIPTPPIANTTYRNTDLGSTELLSGWPYQKIVDSADFNQTLWLISNLVKSCEQYGIMPWCASTTYKQNGICLGSNGIFYWAKQDNTGVNPVTDSGMTNWGVFLDPGDNFVTETVLTSQINLCEKLANKTQTLSSSSTSTQYPSAKAVYDNINNLQTSLQSAISAIQANYVTTNTSQTITAAKKFTTPIYISSALSSNASPLIQLDDTNNKGAVYINSFYTGNQIYNRVQASNTTANKNSSIDVVITDAGNGRAAFVTSGTNENLTLATSSTADSQLALKGWVNNPSTSTNVLHRSGNETASGNKTFSGQIIRSKAPGASDNSTQVPNTFWVNSRITSIMNSRSGVEQPNYATFQGLITSSSASEQSTTAPSKGWIFTRMQLDNNTTRTVSVNGKEIINVRSGAEYSNGNECGACFPVNSGDTISCVRATIYFCSNY